MKKLKTQNCQLDTEGKELNRKIDTTQTSKLTIKLQKSKHRKMNWKIKKRREINECSTREARNRHRYNQIIFDKRAKTLQWILFSTNGSGKTGHPYAKTKTWI